jgi:rhodanese-related sulfurtransferase
MGFWTPFAPREIGPTVVVLDVRNPDEYAAGHVPGAVNIPVGQTFPTEIAALNLELATPIIVYCRSGNRAAEAVRELWALGFTAVQNGRTPEGAMRLLEGN